MKKLVSYSKRPYVYAVLLSLGMILLSSIIHNSTLRTYILASVLLYGLLLFELFSTRYHAEHFEDQYELGEIHPVHHRANLVHHLIIPTVLFLSLVLFLFVNSQLHILLLIIILSLVLFSILFTNIMAYYEDKLRLEKRTANIYDIVSLVAVFLLSYSLTIAVPYFEFPESMAVLLITALVLVIGYLTIARYHLLTLANLSIVIVMSAIVLISGLVLNQLSISTLGITLTSSFYFYFLLVICNHLEDNTLDWKIITEYLAILVFSYVVILLGLV